MLEGKRADDRLKEREIGHREGININDRMNMIVKVGYFYSNESVAENYEANNSSGKTWISLLVMSSSIDLLQE